MNSYYIGQDISMAILFLWAYYVKKTKNEKEILATRTRYHESRSSTDETFYTAHTATMRALGLSAGGADIHTIADRIWR